MEVVEDTVAGQDEVAEVDIVEMEVDTDEDLLLGVEDIAEIHQHQEVVDMMELVLRVEIVHHVHHDVMMGMLHVLLVEKEVKVDIADIVMEDEIVHIILMREEDHMVHKDLQNPVSSLNFGKFITSRFLCHVDSLSPRSKISFLMLIVSQYFRNLWISILVYVC